MSLQTFFSLTPSNPYVYSKDYGNPDNPYAVAVLNLYGVLTLHYAPFRLTDQSQNDEIIIGYNAVPTNNQDIYAGVSPYHRNTIGIHFRGHNVGPENQYLLLFQFTHRRDKPYAQFFLYSEFLDMVEIKSVDQHAILLDCPGPGMDLTVWVRLASPYWWSAMGFNGVDCHLL